MSVYGLDAGALSGWWCIDWNAGILSRCLCIAGCGCIERMRVLEWMLVYRLDAGV